jgi:hypothetical protein
MSEGEEVGLWTEEDHVRGIRIGGQNWEECKQMTHSTKEGLCFFSFFNNSWQTVQEMAGYSMTQPTLQTLRNRQEST